MGVEAPNFLSSGYEGNSPAKGDGSGRMLRNETQSLLADLKTHDRLSKGFDQTNLSKYGLSRLSLESHPTSSGANLELETSDEKKILKYLEDPNFEKHKTGADDSKPSDERRTSKETKPSGNTDAHISRLPQSHYNQSERSSWTAIASSMAGGYGWMKLTESERFNNSLIGKTSTAFLTGVGSVALGFATDIALGITLGYPPKPVGGLGQFALDGIATPAVVLSNLPLRYKLPIATAMFCLGRVSSYLRAKNE